MTFTPRLTVTGAALVALLVLSACEEGGFDFDMRSLGQQFDTTSAVRQVTAERPQPDDRGVISYPSYQVALTRPGETVDDVALRLGLSAEDVARFNGLPRGVALRGGELIALPARVAEPSPATGAPGTGPIRPAGSVDVTAIAGQALDQTDGPQTGLQPNRHRVQEGETAFTIARRYSVPVDALAEWNGLDENMSLRTGQILLIPTVLERLPAAAPSAPGAGSPTPVPPSAATPLPAAAPEPEPAPAAPAAPAPEPTPASDTARFAMPVQGQIIRPYDKGRNDGIGIAAPAGTSVTAADNGTVAAITRDTDQVPIVVIRHAGNLLTVYAGVADVTVEKDDVVTRGQKIGVVRDGSPSFLHFEVREGFESTDPVPYLN